LLDRIVLGAGANVLQYPGWVLVVYGTLEYRTIFAVGLVLFLITLAMNLLSQRITRRFREVYE